MWHNSRTQIRNWRRKCSNGFDMVQHTLRTKEIKRRMGVGQKYDSTPIRQAFGFSQRFRQSEMDPALFRQSFSKKCRPKAKTG